jgi:nucleoside-diphosphate-sugar epimerase
MRIFLTGATGFIGSKIIPELLKAGHQVLGLTRSDAGAKQLSAAGAEVHRGDLEDPTTLRRGAEKADAVIHCAFDHDFSRFVENCQKDKRNIEALGDALVGSKRPLIVTSGTGMGSRGPGELASEDVFDASHANPRKISEETGATVAARGVNVSYVRLPQVHDTKKQGLISPLIEISRAKGRVAYVGEGNNRWPAAHVSDVARLYRLAVERAEPGARYHAVAEEGVTAKDINEALGRSLKLPVVSLTADQVAAHFGWMAMFAGLDMPASSAITRKKLGWTPVGPGLIADLDRLEGADLSTRP